MYAYLAFNLRTARQNQLFGYKIAPELLLSIKIGMLVEANLNGRNHRAVVIKISKLRPPNAKLKSVKKMLCPVPIVLDEQIDLAGRLSRKYAVSFGQALLGILPPLAKIFLSRFNRPAKSPVTGKNPRASVSFIVGSKLDRWKRYSVLCRPPDASLIIFPSKEQAELFRNKFCPAAAVFHSGLTDSQRTQIYLDCLSGKISVVAGALSALFLPLAKIARIIIDDHFSRLYHRDASSKWSVSEAAKIKAKILSVRLYLGTDCPPLFIKFNPLPTDKFIYSLATDLLPQLEKNLEPSQTNLITCLAALDFRLILCRDCQRVLQCSGCRRALAIDFDRQLLFCQNCRQPSALPACCPNCRSPKLKYLVPGVRQFHSQLKQRLNDLAMVEKTTKIDFNASRQIIGNQNIFSLPLKKFDNCHLVLSDFTLNTSSYRQNEDFYYLLHRLNNLSRHKIYLYIKQKSDLAKIRKIISPLFSREELLNRKKYGLPPYGELIALECRDLTKDKFAKKIYNVTKGLENSSLLGSEYRSGKSEIMIKLNKPGDIIDYNLVYPCNLRRYI